MRRAIAGVLSTLAVAGLVVQLLGCKEDGGGPPPGRAWRGAQLVETNDAGDAMFPQIAMDASGNAIVVWDQSDGTRESVWANRYEAATGWGTPELLDTTDTESAVTPQIAMNADGDTMVVWQQGDTSIWIYHIWACPYDASSGWGIPELIEANVQSSSRPQIAIDSYGNAIAVWPQDEGPPPQWNIWTSRYDASLGWGTAAPIETEPGHPEFPQVAVDPLGNAIAVWDQWDSGTSLYNVWANRYDALTGWVGAEMIETDDTEYHCRAQVAMDAAGNAIAVWWYWTGGVWHNRYDQATGWSTAVAIESSPDAGIPQLDINAAGNAIAVWRMSGLQEGIWARPYEPGSGWGAAEVVGAGTADEPQIATSPTGSAVVVWKHNVGTWPSIRANSYEPGTGWGTAELIETGDAGTAEHPQVAIDPDGNAIAVWQQHDGTRWNIWANRFE